MNKKMIGIGILLLFIFMDIGTADAVSNSNIINKNIDVKVTPLEEEWNRTFSGGHKADRAYSVQQTNDGGYILAGYTSSGSYYDDDEFVNSDMWLVKTDTNGKKLWDKKFGGYKSEGANSVQQTNDGGYILAGYTKSYSDTRWGRYSDAWLLKTDSNGNELWNKTFGGGSEDIASSVLQTKEGDYVIAGRSESYHSYPVDYRGGASEFWLVKTDSNGNELWNKTFGSSDKYQEITSFQQTKEGGYILAGNSIIRGRYDVIGDDVHDVWLVKTGSNGNELWNKTFGPNYYDTVDSVQETTDGGYVIGGGTRTHVGDYSNALLLKTDSYGSTVWYRAFGGNMSDVGKSVHQTKDGGYLLICHTNSYGVGYYGDFLLVKTDLCGNELWNKTFGSSTGEYPESAQPTSDGGYIIAGAKGADYTDFLLVKFGHGSSGPKGPIGLRFVIYPEDGIGEVNKNYSIEIYNTSRRDIWSYSNIAPIATDRYQSRTSVYLEDKNGDGKFDRNENMMEFLKALSNTIDTHSHFEKYYIFPALYPLAQGASIVISTTIGTATSCIFGITINTRPVYSYLSTYGINRDGHYELLGYGTFDINILRVACPVNVTITDQYGRSIKDNGRNEIPNATAIITNEEKTFYLPGDINYSVAIAAYDSGVFNFTRYSPTGYNVSITAFENIPITANTIASVEIVTNITNYTMSIDYDGNGNIDEKKSLDINETLVWVQPPIASFTYSPKCPLVNQKITFNASNSTDPDGIITDYKWDFGDGTTTNTTEEIITHFYSKEDDYNVSLTVMDNKGAINTSLKIITVSLPTPTPTPERPIFDTDSVSNPYPSTFGTHIGTVTLNHDTIVSNLYTYPCAGTGGHTEFVRIHGNGVDKSAFWTGYDRDWHNITFSASFVLEIGKTYNYVIITGSYPQIHHTDRLEIDDGVITCTSFVDANGKRYNNWIPAIRLE